MPKIQLTLNNACITSLGRNAGVIYRFMKNGPHYPPKLTRAGECLARMLETDGRPVITPRELFGFIWRVYREKRTDLRLRSENPGIDDYHRLCRQLAAASVIGRDRDYGKRAWRILTAYDLPADEVVCIVDPFCHIANLSAMQRWGLTDRVPHALMLERPDRARLKIKLKTLEEREKFVPWSATSINHPETVRRRSVQINETRQPGISVQSASEYARIATIGQTFLDMLRHPELCGGMAHVLEVWQEHAANWFEQIVEMVDGTSSAVIRCRAGYILEERLGLSDARVESWKAFAQRGGSRKLDPLRPYFPEYSETWMISLNA